MATKDVLDLRVKLLEGGVIAPIVTPTTRLRPCGNLLLAPELLGVADVADDGEAHILAGGPEALVKGRVEGRMFFPGHRLCPHLTYAIVSEPHQGFDVSRPVCALPVLRLEAPRRVATRVEDARVCSLEVECGVVGVPVDVHLAQAPTRYSLP